MDCKIFGMIKLFLVHVLHFLTSDTADFKSVTEINCVRGRCDHHFSTAVLQLLHMNLTVPSKLGLFFPVALEGRGALPSFMVSLSIFGKGLDDDADDAAAGTAVLGELVKCFLFVANVGELNGCLRVGELTCFDEGASDTRDGDTLGVLIRIGAVGGDNGSLYSNPETTGTMTGGFSIMYCLTEPSISSIILPLLPAK